MTVIENKELKDMIYTIRGQQVMLDSDLAMLYGYEVKRLNEQVKRNIERFPDDFMFQLTEKEMDELSRSQFATSIQVAGVKGGRSYKIYAFTEQGIYMLSTVLKGELAVSQSINIMRTFKEMKHFIRNNITTNSLATNPDFVRLAQTVQKNTEDIDKIMNKFIDEAPIEHVAVLAGEMFSADASYHKIISSAKQTIHYIDNYVNIDTLSMLKGKQNDVKVTIFTENKGNNSNKLHQREVNDFNSECPSLIVKESHDFHDRYIILDYSTPEERWYHCGGSNKDAGKKIATIQLLRDVTPYKPFLDALIEGTELIL